jgi:hypothetical protein
MATEIEKRLWSMKDPSRYAVSEGERRDGGRLRQTFVGAVRRRVWHAIRVEVQRIARYREQAKRLREFAVTEPPGAIHDNLLTLADQYDEMADKLTQPSRNQDQPVDAIRRLLHSDWDTI